MSVGCRELDSLSSDNDANGSMWVMLNIQKISKMVGVSFLGLEDKFIELFIEIERRKMDKGRVVSAVKKAKKRAGEGRTRELRRLQFAVSYDSKKKSSRGEGEIGKKK